MNGTQITSLLLGQQKGRTASVVLTLLLACFPVLGTYAAETPQQWLETMIQASRKLTYQGHFVYQQGAKLDTFSISHTVIDGQEQERIVYLDGEPKEMIRKGVEITYSSINRPLARFQHESLLPMMERFTSVPFNKNYQLRPGRLDRVAGRETVQLTVVPMDRFRHGYRLWLDRQTGLLLKSIMLDSEARIIERVQFTNIETLIRLPRKELVAMEKTVQGQANETLVKINSSQDEPEANWGWEAGWVPQGFEAQGRGRRISPVSDREVDTVIYSDGMASFSVFVEPDETRFLSQTSDQIGAMAAVSKVFRNQDEYFHVTVVGEVPLGTAERVAVSVRPSSLIENSGKEKVKQ